MSLIYSITSTISRTIEDMISKSFLFTLIFKIFEFIENEWVNSYFKSLYPSESFLSIFKKSKILKEEIFSPLIVLVTFTLFLLLATEPVSRDLQFTVAIAFISFFIGAILLTRFVLNDSENNPIPLFDTKDVYSIGFCLTLIGIIFLFISIASVGGLPILKGIGLIASHRLNQYKNGEISRSQVRFRFLVLTLIGMITVLTLEYRTPIIAILLMMIIIAYYGEILSVWEVIIGALIGVFAIMGIGYLRSLNELAISTNISIFSTLEHRANFTMHVLNLLNQISGNFGILHGKMIASSMPGSDLGPRMLVGKLIAWRTEVTVTPTLLGQMIVDFGKIGVAIEMCLLGFILGTGYKIIKITKDSFYIAIYSLILTYSILGVETGILDIQILFYFFIISFIYLAAILKDKGIKIY